MHEDYLKNRPVNTVNIIYGQNKKLKRKLKITEMLKDNIFVKQSIKSNIRIKNSTINK